MRMFERNRLASRRMRKIIVLTHWEQREILGRLLGEIEKHDFVKFRCSDNHGDYSVEGEIKFCYGRRLDMRPEMKSPDGIILRVADQIEIIPYNSIRDYEILNAKIPVIMGSVCA